MGRLEKNIADSGEKISPNGGEDKLRRETREAESFACQYPEMKCIEYQKELRSLASQLAVAEERERMRIATQLHERVSQSLALCRIKLGELGRSAPSAAFAREIGEVQNVIKMLIADARSFIFELSPPNFGENGLEAALEELTHEIQEQYGLRISFRNGKQTKPVEEDVRFLLLQIVRELLVNVVKHARASRATVCIKRNGDDLKITVKDDGVGFNGEEAGLCRKRNNGFGLFSIRERLHYIGGQLEIESEPGRGTRVTIIAPLKQE